ncbi:glycosyltransferase [Clavibacter michiganensis]|nr:glycosyltransferase [Clavibacter michiganensis]
MYLAVLPSYRRECIALVRRRFGSAIRLFVSSAHLDESVKTGIDPDDYQEVGMRRLLGNRAFLQTGSWGDAIRSGTLVVDLNPRSVTAWMLLAVRAVLRRRTLVWGHLYPVLGASSVTARLRLLMRRVADGTITYTYSSRQQAQADLPGKPVWVAPNSLYPASEIVPVAAAASDSVLYVGRFAPAKKVDLLVRGFAELLHSTPGARLILIGGGETEPGVRELVDDLGLSAQVEMPGWLEGDAALRPYYERAFCTASPGFAGLGLTQSLGYGIPCAVARGERHSPEIELAETGGVRWFNGDDAAALGSALKDLYHGRDQLPLTSVSARVRELYSADAMAEGLAAALQAETQKLSEGEI